VSCAAKRTANAFREDAVAHRRGDHKGPSDNGKRPGALAGCNGERAHRGNAIGRIYYIDFDIRSRRYISRDGNGDDGGLLLHNLLHRAIGLHERERNAGVNDSAVEGGVTPAIGAGAAIGLIRRSAIG